MSAQIVDRLSDESAASPCEADMSQELRDALRLLCVATVEVKPETTFAWIQDMDPIILPDQLLPSKWTGISGSFELSGE